MESAGLRHPFLEGGYLILRMDQIMKASDKPMNITSNSTPEEILEFIKKFQIGQTQIPTEQSAPEPFQYLTTKLSNSSDS